MQADEVDELFFFEIDEFRRDLKKYGQSLWIKNKDEFGPEWEGQVLARAVAEDCRTPYLHPSRIAADGQRHAYWDN